MPCTKRKAISHSMLGDSAQPIEPRRKQHEPEIERRLAADHVGHRPVDDLAEAEGDEEGHQRHLRRRGRWRRDRPRSSAAPADTCRSRTGRRRTAGRARRHSSDSSMSFRSFSSIFHDVARDARHITSVGSPRGRPQIQEDYISIDRSPARECRTCRRTCRTPWRREWHAEAAAIRQHLELVFAVGNVIDVQRYRKSCGGGASVD